MEKKMKSGGTVSAEVTKKPAAAKVVTLKLGEVPAVETIEDATTTKGCKKHGSDFDASSIEQPQTWKENLYNFLSDGLDLESPKTSVNLSDLRKVTDLSAYLRSIDVENAERNERNKSVLFRAFFLWLKNYTFASIEEKRLAVSEIQKRKKATKNFSVTFYKEMDGDNTKTFERPTNFTAAGLRTSFNSYEYVAAAARREAKERQFNEVCEAIAQLTGKSLDKVKSLKRADLLAFQRILNG